MGLGFDYHALTDKFDIRRINANFQKLENVGLVNPNLLINRNFSINQRGFTIGTPFAPNGYFADCWQAFGGNVTLIDGGGVILASGVQLMQRMEIYYASLFGKTFTLSFLVGGVIKSVTLAFPSSVAGATIYNSQSITDIGTVRFGFLFATATINGTSRAYIPFIDLVTSAQAQIDDSKLEVGSISTILMDKPMGFTDLLAPCQRYGWNVTNGKQYSTIALLTCTSTTVGEGVIHTPVPMRIRPSISRSGAFGFYGIPCTDIGTSDIQSSNNGSIYIYATVGGGLVAGNTGVLRAENDVTAKLFLDAGL